LLVAELQAKFKILVQNGIIRYPDFWIIKFIFAKLKFENT